jgi:polyisoprenoid-binding protein YceI
MLIEGASVMPMDRCERWEIDPERSNLKFTLRHAALGKIAGEFRCWGGHVVLDPSNPKELTVRVWVELSSIDTGSRSRDQAILHTELFDQRWEPALEFDSERLEGDAPDRTKLVGWVGLHGLRKKVSIDVAGQRLETDRSGATRCVCSAKVLVDRRSLGLQQPASLPGWLNDHLVGRMISIAAHVEAAPGERASAEAS